MLEVGPANQNGDDDDLAVFVDRLAAAGTDQSTTDAQTQIHRAIAAGAPPPGLRRLAEALAASVAELPPPRRPPEDTTSVVTAVRDNTLVVLEDFDATATARAVAALLADGRRVRPPSSRQSAPRCRPRRSTARSLTCPCFRPRSCGS